ncbi:MAG: glycosyltransferase [Pirellulales bacterium]|nr:glycosyltransferase [Pirellulales bacterium]
MDPNEFASHLLVHADEECAYEGEIQRLGIPILRCPYARRPWKYAAEFKRLLRLHGPFDVVHSHSYLFSGFILKLAARLGISTRIAHVHPCIDHKKGQPFRWAYQRLMARWLSQHATNIVAPSKSSLDRIKSICDCQHIQTSIVPNVVEVEKFYREIDRDAVRRAYQLPTDRPVVIYVARFAPHKNHAQFMRVANTVNRERQRAHFVLVGSYGPCLEDVCRSARDRDDMSVFTNLSDVSEILLASDVFLFPSLNEGFGVVAIEAAAAGLPVVATDLPTIREACAPCMHPFLFAPNDDALATEHILALLHDTELRRRVVDGGRRFAAQFTCDQSISKLSQLYTASVREAA